MIWFTSDLHFNHNKEFIYKERGFSSIEEMNEGIINNFNKVVQKEDILYILGDVCLGGADKKVLLKNKELIERLNGNIVIITGNHDTDKRYEMYLSCKNVVNVIDCSYQIKYNKKILYLSHYPTITSNLEEDLKKSVFNLYGHTHQKTNFYNDNYFMYHVGVDSHNCFPVKIDDVIENIISKIKEESYD